MANGGWGVVVESSDTMAQRFSGVFGSRSSAAQLLGSGPDPQAEAQVIDSLDRAIQSALGLSTSGAQKQLMRWGAAFPKPPGLNPQLSLCHNSRIGFCGDALEGVGFGRVEGALRSAEALAERLLEAWTEG
jgi:hypothetical protein